MPRERNRESGQFEQVYPDDDILAVLDGTRLATREVADELDCHRTTAHDKLRELETAGLVKATQVGNTLIWELLD